MSLVALAFIVVYSSRIHPALVVYFLVMAPVLSLASVVLTRRIRVLDEEILRRRAELAGSATETLRNIELVKSLGLAEQEIGRLNTRNRLILDLELEKIRRTRVYMFFHGACVHTLRVGMILLVLYLRITGSMTTGQVLLIYLCANSLFLVVKEAGPLAAKFHETGVSLGIFRDVLDEAGKHAPGEGTVLPAISRLEFESVGFSYSSSSQPGFPAEDEGPSQRRSALSDVSFIVEPGEVAAFVGSSGAGKTTLVKLISALYRPTQGRVLFNGLSTERLDADSLRIRMGLVSQDTQLFSGSIRDNLLIVKPDASDGEILACLEQACATGMLGRTAHGLDTVIGEAGLRLSGGERQRLSIARALLRHPDLLIFDEPTSALDAVTEKEIAAGLVRTVRSGRIMGVLITHRLAAAVGANRIYVLDRGGIVESGAHQDLLRAEGLYWRLWQTQMRSSLDGDSVNPEGLLAVDP
jgi:ATP-binding cassette subfamily B protein